MKKMKQEKNKGKIRITYIIPTLDYGGAERFFVDLIKNIDREKFEPSLILYKRGGDWLKELEDLGIEIIILHKNSLIDCKNFFSLIKSLKKIKPDIVHTQLGGDVYGILAAKLAGVSKVLSTEVNTNLHESKTYNLVKRFSLLFSDKVVAVSRAVLSDARKRYALGQKKLELIYNGIRLERFKIKENHFNSRPKRFFVFGTIGRLNEQKGHKILIEAFSKLKNKKTKLLIAGTGELEKDLLKQIEDLGLEKRVKLVGQVDSPKFLNSLDIFVLPSLWEGMGIVLVEAALSGLPIIASSVGGVKEVLSDKEAFLVEAGRVDILSQEMDNLVDNFTTIETAAKIERAGKKMRDMFDILKITRDYENLYKSL